MGFNCSHDTVTSFSQSNVCFSFTEFSDKKYQCQTYLYTKRNNKQQNILKHSMFSVLVQLNKFILIYFIDDFMVQHVILQQKVEIFKTRKRNIFYVSIQPLENDLFTLFQPIYLLQTSCLHYFLVSKYQVLLNFLVATYHFCASKLNTYADDDFMLHF